jgi:hypothetical protein
MSFRNTRDEGFCFCMSISLVITLALFFGLFFGLMYPEIYVSGFKPTMCNLLSTDIIYRYVCSKSCSSCTQTSSSNSCSSVIGYNQALNPKQCLNGTTSQCPIQGQTCGDGYRCCAHFCQTCQSCSSSCSGGTCKQSCTSYSCNCVCISSVSNNQCTVTCGIHYSTSLYVKYIVGYNSNITVDNGDGTTTTINSDNTATISSTYIQDFGNDLNTATNFENYHKTLKVFKCYYDPNNPYVVKLNIDYTAWKWAVFSIFGVIPLMTVLIIWTHAIVSDMTTDEQTADATTTSIWAGIIIPIVILLPIWACGLLNETDKKIVMVFMLLFIGFGNMYRSILYLKKSGITTKESLCLYCYAVLAPLCIYLPIYLYASSIAGTVLFVFTYTTVILFGSCLYCKYNFRIPLIASKSDQQSSTHVPENNTQVPESTYAQSAYAIDDNNVPVAQVVMEQQMYTDKEVALT